MTRRQYWGLIQQLPAADRDLLDDVLVRGYDFVGIADASAEQVAVVRRRYRSLLARLRGEAQVLSAIDVVNQPGYAAVLPLYIPVAE